MAEKIILTKGDLNGRTVQVRVPTVMQLGLVQHQGRVMETAKTSKEQARALEVVFRVLFGMFPEPEDLHYVEDQIAEGSLDVIGLTSFVVDAGNRARADEQDEAPAKVPARRGRPRKAA